MISAEKKFCINCGGKINGRTDKKFCNENCRNNFHNRTHATRNNLIRNINNTLGKNRRILADLAGEEGKAINIPLQKLLNRGYSLSFFTHRAITTEGHKYTFCYDHGLYKQQDGRFVIIKTQPILD